MPVKVLTEWIRRSNRFVPKGLKKGSAACRWMERVDRIDTEQEDVSIGSTQQEKERHGWNECTGVRNLNKKKDP